MNFPPGERPVKAVIFDVYHTLLAVRDGPVDAPEKWVSLWEDFLGMRPPESLREFAGTCGKFIEADHAESRASGMRWPEVEWRSIACRAAPVLAELKIPVLDDFLYQHARLQRTVSAMPEAVALLTNLRTQGILTGIASNAQAYTFRELATAGMPVIAFERDLCFWSFEQGYSKPDPAVFAWLSERLAARGITPEETLMIGDRVDNDMEPAHAAGWRTWHFRGQWPRL